MSRSFDLDALSAFNALKSASERLKDDGLNEDLARDISIKAWHLCEHVLLALGPDSQFSDLSEFRTHIRRLCPDLAYLEDICIESKHGEITKNTPKIKEARFHTGDFSGDDFDHNDFDVSCLEIELPDGRVIPFNKIVDNVLEFWSEFFKNHWVK